MPYYCTVPRCTSMAGKAKNVSFHQFPRDEELASLWNNILKRGKPYTKYSKVCSLHFRPEDYTITSVGKNKGQWRTLRKDAIPSQNLPSESPIPSPHRGRSSGAWLPNNVPGAIDPVVQQQMAQAIYVQTMLAMQAASNGTPNMPVQNVNLQKTLPTDLSTAHTSNLYKLSDLEQMLHNKLPKGSLDRLQEDRKQELNSASYQCQECSKCFKDPDVFMLHRRTHKKTDNLTSDNLSLTNEKENFNSNSGTKETLRANPILANLLKSETNEGGYNNILDANNILSIENQIMTALAANVESYIRNLSSMLSHVKQENIPQDESSDSNDNEHSENCQPDNLLDKDSRSEDDSAVEENCQEDAVEENCQGDAVEENCQGDAVEENCQEGAVDENCQEDAVVKDGESCERVDELQQVVKEGSGGEDLEPNCDNQDLNESKDSNSLVIDENA